jgi:hypothetical protein
MKALMKATGLIELKFRLKVMVKANDLEVDTGLVGVSVAEVVATPVVVVTPSTVDIVVVVTPSTVDTVVVVTPSTVVVMTPSTVVVVTSSTVDTVLLVTATLLEVDVEAPSDTVELAESEGVVEELGGVEIVDAPGDDAEVELEPDGLVEVAELLELVVVEPVELEAVAAVELEVVEPVEELLAVEELTSVSAQSPVSPGGQSHM